MPSITSLLISMLSAIIIVNFKVIRAWIYDFAITKMTKHWYKSVLLSIPSKSRILDVGIGTGAALVANKDIILEKELKIIGVDYDLDYVERCHTLIKTNNLTRCVSVYHQSFYDFGKAAPTEKTEPFDYIYFSGSLMIMPNPVGALTHAVSLLKKNKTSAIYTTQTFEKSKNTFLEFLKPLLKFITTIDFGRVTYENDFKSSVQQADLTIVEDQIVAGDGISASVSKSDRAFHCIKLQPQE